MIELSPEQIAIRDDHGPLCVMACAGSGKTRTAVHHLAEMRGKNAGNRSRIALLSFSNVAVDTFRADYRKLLEQRPAMAVTPLVEIETVDAFLTGLVLRPHGHRTMQAPRSAFLVAGTEPFLGGFTFFDGTHARPTKLLTHSREGGSDTFRFRNGFAMSEVDTAEALRAVNRLGKTGAYTHDLGRYWAHRTLMENPRLTEALARRYPIILVDEAQDIGSTQEAIFNLLIDAGSQLSLIGDVNQGIFEFAGATGEFLSRYGERAGVASRGLTVNFRSVPRIVTVANQLTGRNDTADRVAPAELHGAYFIGYAQNQPAKLVEAFRNMVATAGLHVRNAAIVCRSTPMVKRFGGADEAKGQGIVRGFTEAAIARDQLGNYPEAFKVALRCVIALLADDHRDIASRLARGGREVAALRRAMWMFVRNPETGLPKGSLLAVSQWHPALVSNVRNLLARLKSEFGLDPCATIGQRLKKSDLVDAPLFQTPDPAAPAAAAVALRADTVHQVKGESIDAVMYVATKQHAVEMLAGVGTEDGRIGYVALTRARNLFLLAVPTNTLSELKPQLLLKGFLSVGEDGMPVRTEPVTGVSRDANSAAHALQSPA